ncbi:peptidoglycan-binding protein [Sedimentibacter sp.]|uniref:peptidoglycan-binding domain-containing protein n=1 Tax=Sedimentibacter sp. TaxID=1960295 RepID=UPI002898A4B7|nr:peptidoglycan-binding protein [Sedimentibacter sp.]
MHINKAKNKNRDIRALQEINVPPNIPIISIPTNITVHLGAPEDDAENVTVPFIDYIKNVASSELYPTWPDSSLRANIIAITSVALNRIYTEWYRSRGYNFDITNDTRYDQSYVHNRGIFDNISIIADQIFNYYLARTGQDFPLYARFCDGRISLCDGLQQWGTVELANAGYTFEEILRYYYGENIEIITNAPQTDVQRTYPGGTMSLGYSSLNILRMQYNLERIRLNYPAIPSISQIDGFFGPETEAAVKAFQGIFQLPQTGVIDEGTWYRIIRTYTAVTKLAELSTEGLIFNELYGITSEQFLEGDVRPGVDLLQYALNVLSAFYDTVPAVPITSVYDYRTRDAVLQYQKIMGLPQTGIANEATINSMYVTVMGILEAIPPEGVYIPVLRWPGINYSLGHESPGVYVIQEMLSYISLIMPEIPYINPNGIYDETTQRAVTTFQSLNGLDPTGTVNEQTWNLIVSVYRQQRFGGITIV